MKKYDIFISYRRDGGFETANLIAGKLKLSGYRVFLDIHAMHAGDFSEQLKEKVRGCKDFIWVLSPTNVKNEDGSFSRVDTLSFRKGIDYYRDEICWAIEFHKNIVPIILDGFIVPEKFPEVINDSIQKHNQSCDLHKLQAVEASKNQYFDASVSELKRYLRSLPVNKWKIISSFAALLLLSVVALIYLFRLDTTCNCVITLNESQQHPFKFEGGDVELIIDNKSFGICHIHSIKECATFLDLKSNLFNKQAVIKFSSNGYLPQSDTIVLAKNIRINIIRDDTYAKYWGTILDYQTDLPIDSVKVIIDDKETYTNKSGQYEIRFPIEGQTEYKRMMAIKDGYVTYEKNVIYPRECRFHLRRNR